MDVVRSGDERPDTAAAAAILPSGACTGGSDCVRDNARSTIPSNIGIKESAGFNNVIGDFGLATRVARYHNAYGPFGTWDGGREKAPAAISRKVAMAAITGQHDIEIWGDGEQTRSFMYIDDCLKGTQLLMQSSYAEPLNVGSDEMVSINHLVDVVEAIASIKLKRTYKLDAPLGVRGRNSDNTLIHEVLGWVPSTKLQDGMERTYRWIYDQAKARAEGRSFVAAYE